MELSSKFFELAHYINREPGVLVAFASFHPIVLFVLGIPLFVLKKIGLNLGKINFGKFGVCVATIIGIGWILGFASQILLMFMGVSGIKMLLIYLSMYLVLTVFVFSNAGYFTDKNHNKLMQKFSAKE